MNVSIKQQLLLLGRWMIISFLGASPPARRGGSGYYGLRFRSILRQSRRTPSAPFVSLARGLVLLTFAFGGTLYAHDAYIPTAVERGGTVTLVVYPDDPIDKIDIGLRNPDDTIMTTAHGFAWQIDDTPIWVAIMGISSAWPPGEYQIDCTIYDVTGRVSATNPIEILPRDFLHEEIALDDGLTTLRTTPDPRKADEARQLTDLLAKFDAQDIYHHTAFVSPLPNARETSQFGDRRLFRYSSGSNAQSIHNGLDLAGAIGTPLAAAAAGKVVFADERIITGNSIVIAHMPGLFSLYYHLDTRDVHVGEIVAAGQRIGTLGNSGLATGPHLHWEIRAFGVAIDPKSLLETPLVDIQTISIHNTRIIFE